MLAAIVASRRSTGLRSLQAAAQQRLLRSRLSSSSSSMTPPVRPARRTVSAADRVGLRAARKERASRVLQEAQQQGGSTVSSTVAAAEAAAATTSTTTAAAATAAKTAGTTGTTSGGRSNVMLSRYVWYLSVGVPSALLMWGLSDETSPPAQFSRWIGLTAFVGQYTEEIARPSHTKLLPDWSQIPNVPHDIPVPHTLVLDLENTLVTSTWHRKHGWRHAKRPGVDKFLHDMAQYYEIVLYSPSIDGIAHPVVEALDKDGCIMHRLYRDATYYHNGVHVKDLKSLNRNVKRMIVLDDDPDEVQFNPENLVRVKPYVDPNDRDDTTLERITPFLIEIARENYEDIPTLLAQYQGMDADEIADEQERRWIELERSRRAEASHGLGRWARAGAVPMPAPELPPPHQHGYRSGNNNKQLTAKDIAGAAPPASATGTLADGGGDGLMGFLNRRAKEKEEHQMRKMETWQKAMMKKQKEREMQQQQ